MDNQLALARAIVRQALTTRARVITIDGASGSGKSSLADAVLAVWPGNKPELLRLDDLYPGWAGMESGVAKARSAVAALSRGTAIRLIHWDWSANRPSVGVLLKPRGIILIEGCGARQVGSARSDCIDVFLAQPVEVRRKRFSERDSGSFDPYWTMWDRQWRRYEARTPNPSISPNQGRGVVRLQCHRSVQFRARA